MAKTVWQVHHLSYPDGKHKGETVRIRKIEHWFLTRLSWMGAPSPGFKVALMQYLAKWMFGEDVVSKDEGEKK